MRNILLIICIPVTPVVPDLYGVTDFLLAFLLLACALVVVVFLVIKFALISYPVHVGLVIVPV